MIRTSTSSDARTRTRGERAATDAALALTLCMLGACARPVLETATELPKTPRSSPGVLIELPPTFPPVRDVATIGAGAVALRAPPDVQDAEELVSAYVRAFVREDEQALAALLTEDAAPLPPARGRLIEVFRTRLRNFDFTRLAGLEVARLGAMELVPYDALAAEAGGASLRRPDTMKPGDVLIRVPMDATSSASTGESLFGEVLVLVVRRVEGRLRIAGQADEPAR